MAKKTFITLAIGSSLLFSCQKNGATDPWSFTSPLQNKGWIPPLDEMRKITEIIVQDSSEIPDRDKVLNLSELFDIGLRNSPTLAEVWQTAREAAAAYGESLAPFYPSIYFQTNLRTQKTGYLLGNNNAFVVSDATFYGPYALLNYTLWDSGERVAQSESNLQALNYANWSHGQAIQQLLQFIATSFYNYLAAKANLVALEQNLIDAKENYLAAEENFKLGIKDITDLLQAKTKYIENELEVVQQTATVENAYINLLKTIGIPTNTKIHLPIMPESPPIEELDFPVEKLIEIAKTNRPEYLAAKADVLSKEANVDAQKAQFYPQIGTQITAGQTWFTTGATDNGTYTIQLNLTLPIFTGFLYQNQVRQAESALKASVSSLRQAELSITSQVRTTYNSFDADKKRLQMVLNYLSAAEDEYKAVFLRYKQGTIDILEVFSSSASLANARSRSIDVKRDFFIDMINLTFATGILNNKSEKKRI
jgi:outer membrane protein